MTEKKEMKRRRDDDARDSRPTAMTIARRLGVSKSTISRALKDDPSISATMRRHIQELAREIGYRPNAMARSLVTRRSGVIAFILGDSQNPFYPEQIDRLLPLLRSAGFQLMLFQVPAGADVADIIPTLLQYQLDACVIASVTVSSQADKILSDHQLPTVLINRVPRNNHGCAVLCNNIAGGRDAATYLLSTGARKLAFVSGPNNVSTSLDREQGFVSCLREHGRELHARADGKYTFEGGMAAARELLDRADPPDAVFCANDIMALGVLDFCREQGIRVPEDVQIIGFDNIRAASWPAYSLTTVAQPMELMLERAVELIRERIEGKQYSESVIVNGELVLRKSTRTPLDG